MTPEILAVLAAAATAFLGRQVRVRSAELLGGSAEAGSPWAHSGRATIHASHNLSRGRWGGRKGSRP